MTRVRSSTAVAAMLAALWGWLLAAPAAAWPASTTDPGEVSRTVEQVLRRPAFATARPSWLGRIRQAVQRWFGDRLADLFGSGVGRTASWVVVGVVVVAALVLVARLAAGTRRGAGRDGPTPALHVQRSVQDWLDQARAALATGDHGEAVRCGYGAVVAALAARGLVDEVPGRTVGEYRAQLRANAPDRVAAFVRASDVFEIVWYAQRPASDRDVAAVLAVADEFAGVAA